MRPRDFTSSSTSSHRPSRHRGGHLRAEPRPDRISGRARRHVHDGEAVDVLPAMTENSAMATTAELEQRWIKTRFGRYRVDQKSVVLFPEGLPGFEQNRRFV